MHRKIKKAVLPVGGMGTRFLPATKALPKEMLPIINKPLIQYAFEEAVNAGIEEFIFITGRNKNIIINHFDCVYELEKVLNDNDKFNKSATKIQAIIRMFLRYREYQRVKQMINKVKLIQTHGRLYLKKK